MAFILFVVMYGYVFLIIVQKHLRVLLSHDRIVDHKRSSFFLKPDLEDERELKAFISVGHQFGWWVSDRKDIDDA